MNLPPLLPCPFCGGEPRIALGEHDFDGSQVECKNCAASGGHHSGDKYGKVAISEWNKREAVAAAVPEGWKLVPIEPTEEMFDSAWSAFGATKFEHLHAQMSLHDVRELFKEFVAAMLASSPEVKP